MADKKTYSEKLIDPRWRKKRLEILQRDECACRLCGDRESPLHVHHNKYTGNPWDAPDINLITLCKNCHENYEYFKSLRAKGLTLKNLIIKSDILKDKELCQREFDELNEIISDSSEQIFNEICQFLPPEYLYDYLSSAHKGFLYEKKHE